MCNRNFVRPIVVNLIEIGEIQKYIQAPEFQIGESQMPTYEYQCRECGHTFDEYQPITAEPLVVCPNCGKHALKRVMGTGGGLIFKGSGFYQTDYKKNGSSPAPSTTKKEKPPEPKTSETKSETAEKKSPPPAKKE